MIKSFYLNKRLLILTFILIFSWGMSSFQALPRYEDPELVSRVAVVNTSFPGASAEKVEALVTEVLESEIAEIEAIKTLESDSRVGFSSITIELVDAVKDAQPIWSEVKDEIADATSLLPPGARVPQLEEIDVKAYSALVALTWQGNNEPNYAILGRYGQALETMMRRVSGTEKVEIFGDPQEEITVEIDAAKLVAVGLSSQELAEQINLSDAKATAGQLRSDRTSIAIEVDSELKTLERIRQIPIQNNQGQFTRLGDVAVINRGIQDPPKDLALIRGQPAVVVGAIMKSGERIDLWAKALKEEMAKFEVTVPQGVSLDLIFDQSTYVEARMDNLISNLVMSALLVMVITLVTMGWRSAFVVSMALPLTTFMVLGCMNTFGIPIHQMSVTGLIIALGLLIDNAIVVVDEIKMEMRKGEKPLHALTKTVHYLKAPLFASTLTTVLTFMPIALLPGSGGEFVGSIAVSVIMALISSLALSLTVIASSAARILPKNSPQLEQGFFHPDAWWNAGFNAPWLGHYYRKSIQFSLGKPLFSMALCFVIPLVGFLAAGTLKSQFFPSLSRNQFQIEVEFPSPIAISQTKAKMLQARNIILAHQNVEEVSWFIGESAPMFYYNIPSGREDQSNYAQGMVQLNTGEQIETIVRDLQKELDEQFPSARILVRQLEQGPPFDAPIEMRIYGSDINELRRLGMEARRILAGVLDVTQVRDDLSETLPKLDLSIDEEQAKQAGLTNTAIAQQLESYLEGMTGGSILEGTENLPVRVRISNTQRGDLSQIASLNLSSNNDHNFRPTSALGNFSLVPQLARISRRNEQRINTVQGFINPGVLPSVVLTNFQNALEEDNFQLPPGYFYEWGGELEESSSSIGDLLLFIPILLVIMISALVLSLNSFRQAGIVAGVAVGCIGTALFALRLANAPLGFMAIIGIMGLVGIAINDTIVVLSALNEDPQSSQGHRNAVEKVVIQATRHVLTTTITTIAGFLPLLISGGPFWRPLAIAIAGGITGSSILALYFVPVLYLELICQRTLRRLRDSFLQIF